MVVRQPISPLSEGLTGNAGLFQVPSTQMICERFYFDMLSVDFVFQRLILLRVRVTSRAVNDHEF